MAKKSKKSQYICVITPTSSAIGEEAVARVPGKGGVELHAGLWGIGGKAEEVDWEKFHENWLQIRDQVAEMMRDFSKRTFGSMELDELQVGLTATGKGSIGIASVSAAANIMLTFKQKAG